VKKFQHDFVEVLAFQTAKDGKEYCGDSYYMNVEKDQFVCVLADGLGSGKFAYEASSAVIDVIKGNLDKDVDSLMHECNKILVNKRGAAVSLIKVDFQTHEFVYSCVGNIRCYLYNPSGRTTYPLPVMGYLSGKPQIFRTQCFTFDPHSKFLLHSDGLRVSNSKSLLQSGRSLEVIASEIEKQQMSKTDDSTFILGSLL
jgi:phosphoserine phosphatase RsbX